MEYLNVRTMEKSKGLQPSDSMPQTERPLFTVQDQGYTMSQDNDISSSENVILQTKNYGMFKIDPHNRPIRQDKIDRLYDAIQQKNLLHLFPIVVSRNYTIIDGQHRYKAAEALNVPICYIVSSQMQIEDAAAVNANTNNWKIQDYLHHWCSLGLEDYILIREFQAANDFLSLATAAQLCAPTSKGGEEKKKRFTDTFYSGNYRVTNASFAARVAGMARDFSPFVSFWKDTKFLRALANLAANPNYNHRHMMGKVEYLSTRLVKCADLPMYMELLESIYNYRVPDGKKVNLRKQTLKTGESRRHD